VLVVVVICLENGLVGFTLPEEPNALFSRPTSMQDYMSVTTKLEGVVAAQLMGFLVVHMAEVFVPDPRAIHVWP
jgi:hypothetical protein